MSGLSTDVAFFSFPTSCTGVESPTIGNSNTISTRARLHHTARLTSFCVIGAGCLVVPAEDEVLEDYTVSLDSSFQTET